MDSDNKLDKIANDVQEIKLSLVKMDMTLERNTDSLENHIKRTDLLESKVEVLKEQVTPVLKDIQPVIKYWKLLSVIVILTVTGSNPALLPVILKYFGVVVP